MLTLTLTINLSNTSLAILWSPLRALLHQTRLGLGLGLLYKYSVVIPSFFKIGRQRVD